MKKILLSLISVPLILGFITGCGNKTKDSETTIGQRENEQTKTIDNSGANKPVLYTNMIPVVYDGTKWLYSDGTQTNWYNYTDKQWANAVVLNSGVTKNVGDEVTEEDVALWYVWIPRYKYTIFNGNNGSAVEQLINVTFESGTGRTGTVTCSDNADGSETCIDSTNGSIKNGTSTYTHPAFKFGNTELTGFWVGKFEVSGTIDKITIKPNETSLSNAYVSSFFTAIQNVKTTYGINDADSHMLKNMEWGAVAYLKQSKYGLGTTDIGINNNSNNITGCGADAGSEKSATCNSYNTAQGMLASTTGNIYGVYDMAGGENEFVMGNMKDTSNEFDSSGAKFSTNLDAKYYDSYKYGRYYDNYERGKLGDATKETLTTSFDLFGGGGWYSDNAVFPYDSYSWFVRGGGYYHGAFAGVFYYNNSLGGSIHRPSARAVLSAL